jgi:predicted nucleotidyltransferase
MHPTLSEKREQLIAACRRFHVARLDVFGSAARGDDFDPDRSDADFLVDFDAEAKTDPYLDLKAAFESILGRRVDLIDRHALETSRNYLLRRSILTHTEAVYAA